MSGQQFGQQIILREQISFLEFPREIREMVYDAILASYQIMKPNGDLQDIFEESPAFYRLNRQIYIECRERFLTKHLSKGRIYVDSPAKLVRLAEIIPQPYWPDIHVKKLIFTKPTVSPLKIKMMLDLLAQKDDIQGIEDLESGANKDFYRINPRHVGVTFMTPLKEDLVLLWNTLLSDEPHPYEGMSLMGNIGGMECFPALVDLARTI